MKRVGMTWRVAPEHWEEYKVTVWVEPEAEDGAGVQFIQLEQVFYCP